MLTWAFEHESEGVALILSLKCNHIVVARALENLGYAGKVETQRQAAIAAVVLEALSPHQQRNQRNMRRIHRLQVSAPSVCAAAPRCHDVKDQGHWRKMRTWSARPVLDTSKLASFTSSRMDSIIFLIRLPWVRRASNMVGVGRWEQRAWRFLVKNKKEGRFQRRECIW